MINKFILYYTFRPYTPLVEQSTVYIPTEQLKHKCMYKCICYGKFEILGYVSVK